MSCLFNSMSHFFPEDSNTIRQRICDYLERGGSIIEGLDTNFHGSLILINTKPKKNEYM